MHKIVVERELRSPVGEVWRILDDFGAVDRYHPRVVESSIDNGIASGTGAERTCRFASGERIRERITDYEAGEAYTVEITDPGPLPLKSAVARWFLRPVDEDRSRIRFEMTFQPKYGPLGWIMGATIIQTRLRKTIAEVLAGLETHARSGKSIDLHDGLAKAA
jgi:uncharacterized protein YndB with AHSA1/START domain